MNAQLFEMQNAINRYYSSTIRPASETLDGLAEVAEHIDAKIDTLQVQLSKEK